jgi:hypothetical protein
MSQYEIRTESTSKCVPVGDPERISVRIKREIIRKVGMIWRKKGARGKEVKGGGRRKNIEGGTGENKEKKTKKKKTAR